MSNSTELKAAQHRESHWRNEARRLEQVAAEACLKQGVAERELAARQERDDFGATAAILMAEVKAECAAEIDRVKAECMDAILGMEAATDDAMKAKERECSASIEAMRVHLDEELAEAERRVKEARHQARMAWRDVDKAIAAKDSGISAAKAHFESELKRLDPKGALGRLVRYKERQDAQLRQIPYLWSRLATFEGKAVTLLAWERHEKLRLEAFRAGQMSQTKEADQSESVVSSSPISEGA
jgi:hypothetical protein